MIKKIKNKKRFLAVFEHVLRILIQSLPFLTQSTFLCVVSGFPLCHLPVVSQQCDQPCHLWCHE